MKRLTEYPISVGAAAVYKYSEELLEECSRMSRYSDEPYNLATVVGHGANRRIWIPRNMAPGITEDYRVKGVPVSFNSSFKARNSEQTRVIYETVNFLEAGMSFGVRAPTGFGKTICAMEIIAQVGRKTIVVVTKEDIYDQWHEAFRKVLNLSPKEIGIIKGDICRTIGCKVVIAFIQSVYKENRYPASTFRDAGLVIFDEGHRVGSDNFSQACYRIPALLRLRISATQSRKDGKDEVLDAHIGPILVETTLAPMTPKVISRESPWECPVSWQKDSKGNKVLKPIPHSAGKCGHILKMLANHHGRNMLLVNFIAACYKKDRKILIQSHTLDHLDTLMSMVSSAGVPVSSMALYVGGMTKAGREAAKTKQLIFSTYQMTREATDIPTLDALAMAGPVSDPEQIVGRVIRFMPDKKTPIVFDIRDSTSPVFKGYWNSRKRWYDSVNAEVDYA